MAKKPTLRDISSATGLSVYTVSRALNHEDGVSDASREAVLTAAQQLGYVPNRAAQQLRKNTRSSVAVLTASSSNYYYIDLMRGVQQTLRLTGRTALVADIASGGVYTEKAEESAVRSLVQSRTAGVITTLSLSDHSTQLLGDWDIPVVFVDSLPRSHAVGASVTTDNIIATAKVGEHLASHGYANWLLVIYPDRWSTRNDRELGMIQAAQRAGATLEILESENDNDSAYDVVSKRLEDRRRLPDVIIAGNNPMVHGTLHALQDEGLSVPHDVAVIGFDEFAWAPLLNPPLTVLNEDAELIGTKAAQSLTALIERQIEDERRGLPPHPRYLPEDRQEVEANLIIRRSCGCSPGAT